MSYRFLLLFIINLFWIKSESLAQQFIDPYEYDNNTSDYDKGQIALQDQNYEKAIYFFTKILKEDSLDGEAYTGRATAYLKQRKLQMARKDVRMAMNILEDQSNVLYLAGTIEYKLKSYLDAEKYFSEAIENHQKSRVYISLIDCRYNRANSYLQLRKYADAISDFSYVIQNDENFPNAYHNRGIAFKKLKQRSKACADFKVSLEKGGDKSQYYIDNYCN